MNAPHFYSISDFMVKFHPETGNVILWKELDILNPWHMDSNHLFNKHNCFCIQWKAGPGLLNIAKKITASTISYLRGAILPPQGSLLCA